MVKLGTNNEGHDATLLIVEPDGTAAERLASALGRPCWLPGMQSDGSGPIERGACDCPPPKRCCTLIDSLTRLQDFDLSGIELVICAMRLPDGSGLEALAHVRGAHPDLPLVLTGNADDATVAARAMRDGAMGFLLTDPDDPGTLPSSLETCLEHLRIRRENQWLREQLHLLRSDLTLKEQDFEILIRQLEATARTDELTGLANRRWLNIMLEGSWAEALRHSWPLGFLMIDLDGFKALNDTMGHLRGDELLRLTGMVLEANCRDVDVVARYGGDEFCVLMPNTLPHEAVQVAERIQRQFERAMSRRGPEEPLVGMTIGMSHIDLSRPVNSEELVSHADEALYGGKVRGKNRVMIRDMDGVYAPMR